MGKNIDEALERKESHMNKNLVAYFSASGTTARVAKKLADAIGADLFEIVPQQPYTSADLNWQDRTSRTTAEKNDRSLRPAIAGQVSHMEAYDTVFLGFPIWWYGAPNIINTFLESYDFKGKTIVPFATSGGSAMGRTNDALAPSYPGAKLCEGRRFASNAGAGELKAWAETFC